MPWPFRKKKKKELPEPPSFSKQDDSPFLEPPKESSPAPVQEPSIFEGAPIHKGPPIHEEPPRHEGAPIHKGPPIHEEPPRYEGPPRQSPAEDVSSPSGLPPPPIILGKVPPQPSIKSEQSTRTPLFDDEIADEIHAELRQRAFGSTMKKVPERKAVSVSTEELAKRRLRDSKQEYIEAGNKHLELNFYDNAATNYACAILCDLIGEGWQSARQTMSKLISGVPSAVVENSFFDNVRLLLEAIRSKNINFLTRAEQAIQKSMKHLYPEDVAMVEKAIKTARAFFGY
ncbi:MAG: hypothetical protein JSU57_02815 [Candidatus Heimdallarchaeota archaeon]|nr:MAG: hypothetical protein JSU57_02815 [Candidatus Heimdallarchaeota archaeon]